MYLDMCKRKKNGERKATGIETKTKKGLELDFLQKVKTIFCIVTMLSGSKSYTA